MAFTQPHDRDRTVYLLLHQDQTTVCVLGVFAEIQDANRDCLWHAKGAGVDLIQESSTFGPDKGHISPVEPARWDTAEGISCWVESHTVEPSRMVKPASFLNGAK